MTTGPRVQIVVPWKPGQSQRERAWKWARPWWSQFGLPIEVVEQEGREPFNRSWCVNEGARRTWPWDVLVFIDADTFEGSAEQIPAGIASAWETGRLTVPHTSGADLSDRGTQLLIEGSDKWGRHIEGRRKTCTSRVTIVRADLFEAVGGLDTRFRGWGWEDVAFFRACRTLRGVDHLPGTSFHLWHPQAYDTARKTDAWKEGRVLCDRYIRADVNGWPDFKPVLDERKPAERWDRPAEGIKPRHTSGPPRPTGGGTVTQSMRRTPARPIATTSEMADRQPDRGIDMIVLTAGRKKYLERTLQSFEEQVSGDFKRRLIFDDSGDKAFGKWLARECADYEILTTPGKLGFTEAIRNAWGHLGTIDAGSPYIFHLEEDFTFDRKVDLGQLIAVLEAQPRLAQVSLLRGPAYPPEYEAGGIIEQDPAAYSHRRAGDSEYLIHRKYFTTNPCVYRRELLKVGWPAASNSEVAMTKLLIRKGYRFAHFGDGTPWVSHIGEERTNLGY